MRLTHNDDVIIEHRVVCFTLLLQDNLKELMET